MLQVYVLRAFEDNNSIKGVLLAPFENIHNGEMSSFVCYTLELPWKENQRSISCVKGGDYEARMEFSPSFNRHLLSLENKHGREWIRFHAGNKPSHTRGCILVGRKTGRDRVTHAREAEDALARFIYRKVGEEKAHEWGNIKVSILEGGTLYDRMVDGHLRGRIV